MARIILVEDDPISAHFVCDALFDAGYAVGWMDKAKEALAMMKLRPPQLAILDCSMPEMTGVQLLTAMRLDEQLADVPVLMLTARQSGRDEDIAFSAGADDYLRKPADPDHLLGRIDALLMRKESLPSRLTAMR